VHEVADAVEYDPGAQLLVNEDNPKTLQNFPGAHTAHVSCAARGWYEPGGQSLQKAMGIDELRFEPGGQCKKPAGAKAG
jgi:hypothetical protein